MENAVRWSAPPRHASAALHGVASQAALRRVGTLPMRPRQFTCLLTGAAALLFVVHVQFRPEFTQPKIVKPKPEPNRYQHAHPKAPAFKEPPAPTLAVPSASADGRLGALGVEAYTGGSPYDCTPSHVPRGTRALDLIAPAEAEWPTNCEVEDNEPLCAVLRKTAVQREVLTAVCNANVIGQLEKWVDANRRSGIANMVSIAIDPNPSPSPTPTPTPTPNPNPNPKPHQVIIAIDSKLPTWLEANNVPYWHKVQSAHRSHTLSPYLAISPMSHHTSPYLPIPRRCRARRDRTRSPRRSSSSSASSYRRCTWLGLGLAHPNPNTNPNPNPNLTLTLT